MLAEWFGCFCNHFLVSEKHALPVIGALLVIEALYQILGDSKKVPNAAKYRRVVAHLNTA